MPPFPDRRESEPPDGIDATAEAHDAADPLAAFRERFELPGEAGGPARVYLLGNSLGPLPRATRGAVREELDAWAARGVDSYFEAPRWYGADERYRDRMARLVGAGPGEVALMNGLTVNLHLLFASFYRPDRRRRKILIERPAFPSDRYVVETQMRWHGIDPATELIEVEAPAGDLTGAIVDRLATSGDEIAVVFVGGVNFLTGERLDLGAITEAAHARGAVAGFDLAHAAGNVPLALHEDQVDFAAWCTYKYLNAGPGAVAGVFVHERHAGDVDVPRLGGWWGNDPGTRFRMQELPDFIPRADAAGWQLSCPPVLAMAPLGPALDLFEEAGLGALRDKSVRLTGYLERSLDEAGLGSRLLTPRDPERRGAQLSLRLAAASSIRDRLAARGIDVDLRRPDVLRFAPAPLFNTFRDVRDAVRVLVELADEPS